MPDLSPLNVPDAVAETSNDVSAGTSPPPEGASQAAQNDPPGVPQAAPAPPVAPRPASPAARPGAPRIRIERGATVYAPWRKEGEGAETTPAQKPPTEAPRKAAAPPASTPPPSVRPPVRPVPTVAPPVPDAERTIEMTAEFSQESLASAAPPPESADAQKPPPTLAARFSGLGALNPFARRSSPPPARPPAPRRRESDIAPAPLRPAAPPPTSASPTVSPASPFPVAKEATPPAPPVPTAAPIAAPIVLEEMPIPTAREIAPVAPESEPLAPEIVTFQPAPEVAPVAREVAPPPATPAVSIEEAPLPSDVSPLPIEPPLVSAREDSSQPTAPPAPIIAPLEIALEEAPARVVSQVSEAILPVSAEPLAADRGIAEAEAIPVSPAVLAAPPAPVPAPLAPIESVDASPPAPAEKTPAPAPLAPAEILNAAPAPPLPAAKPILGDPRLAPGQSAPNYPAALPPVNLDRPKRSAPLIPQDIAPSALPKPPPYRVPGPSIPGYRAHQAGDEAAQVKAEQQARENEKAKREAETALLRRFSPSAPGAAYILAALGVLLASLGLLARPLAEATRLPAFRAVADFTDGLENDSRMQWRNRGRRPAGRAVSAGQRSQARVVVVLAPTKKAAPGQIGGVNLPTLDRRGLAGLMRLCYLAGTPTIGLAMDTTAFRSPKPPAPTPTPGPSAQRPTPNAQRLITQSPTPDPLAAVIREIRIGVVGPRPTFTVLPAFFDQNTGAGQSGAPRLMLTDPRLPRTGVATGFVGPPPAVSGAVDSASSPKNKIARRSFALAARAYPADDPKAAFSKAGGDLRRALSFPASVALLSLPDAALWPQEGGAETADSAIPVGLAGVFAWPAALNADSIPGERPCAIDYGLLQSDPEGVQVISADYLRGMTADDRSEFLAGRPVVIGIDRPVDRVTTPLSSRLFAVAPPLKMRMTRAEVEGRAAAMLLARADRSAQSGMLPTLPVEPEDLRGPNGDQRPEAPGRVFSAVRIPPPAPYMEPLPASARSWAVVLPAALLGCLFMMAGRRIAAPSLRRASGKTIARADQPLIGFGTRLLRGTPALLGLALAATLGWLWRTLGTPGFGAYLEYPAFWPWASPAMAAAAAAAVYLCFLFAAWAFGPLAKGRGLAIVAFAAAIAFFAVGIADFVLFPAWTPLLAPAGALLLGAALPLGQGAVSAAKQVLHEQAAVARD